MLFVIDHSNRAHEHQLLRAMFEARKRVFIDLLKWDLPVLADRFEIDHFDDPHATYLIVGDPAGRHLASARLLPTTRPALLDGIFPTLVDGAVPSGPDIFEITRFCLSPGIGARQRRMARDTLLVGLVDFALANGIRSYTGVAEIDWFAQIRTFGWDCRALGEPALHDGRALTSLRIEIDAGTPAKLEASGIIADRAGEPVAANAA
ncbi:acyl-homoserine-lactone synthase [Sphingopyxis sp. SCN 67-31]|uniref:acyl-homoserine-lactone synthase n=1 Tax=Sphingopyxis sp. SCN 67-31 TaxID=1660142 RepID=UPI00086AB524|nr:acyl-homoserine-lactone synthase [Sphingopyxis sp. SCN 67-31]KAB2855627.1 MAG: autoinducer synthase [Sphingopyxis terrae]ODU35110.1 MAG: autoinducer synthase [Sphingopyxis sp. SCN 67-31]